MVSHSLAGIQIHNNYLLHFSASFHISRILTFLICYLTKVRQGHGVLFRNIIVRWQMSTSTRLPNIFALALAFSEILTLTIFDLQKVGQSHGVQFSQISHSMANVKIDKLNFCYIFYFR